MKISDFRTTWYRIPLDNQLTDATHGRHDYYDLVVVEVGAAGGAIGLGYTYTVHGGGASIHALIEHDLRPLIIGADSKKIEMLWNKMWHRTHYIGRGGISAFAISAVDIALWDLRGTTLDEPLWRLLGGVKERIPAYSGGIDLLLSTEELLIQTHKVLENGFRAVKMKVGRENLIEDIERVGAVRDLVGPQIVLMVDANMKWTVTEAIDASRALSAFKPQWLEEPIQPDDFIGHYRVATEAPLMIAAGENLRTVTEFEHLISAGGVAFLQPDVSNVGGITAWMKVARIAELHNLPVTSHGVHEFHVHLLSAIPNSSYLEVHGFATEKFVKDPPRFEMGDVIPPDRPGHGVVLNFELLEHYRRG